MSRADEANRYTSMPLMVLALNESHSSELTIFVILVSARLFPATNSSKLVNNWNPVDSIGTGLASG